MKEQDWIDAGYAKYKTPITKMADGLLQKCVLDEELNVAYFLNVYVYDWTKAEWVARGMSERGVTFSYEVCLFQEDETEFRVSGEVVGIEELEKWIAHLYTTLGCISDVHNN